jgi:spermidine synthase
MPDPNFMIPRTGFSVAFFLSGAAALLFETLWFRLAGLAFGNTAWAAAIVLSSFMAGIGLGNLVAIRTSRDPLRLYVALEIGIMLSGVSLVLFFPKTPQLFGALLDRTVALNVVRLIFAFVLLVIPAMLMGATLPTGVRALRPSSDEYTRILGTLYGWNTLGAMAGALAGEFFLIRRFGIRGTGIVAGALDLFAGAIVLMLPAWQKRVDASRRTTWSTRLVRQLIAAGICGFALLALEVLWFRFLVLFVLANALAFAVMLAVVLLGISLGAIAASRLRIDDVTPAAAAFCGIAVIVGYSTFHPMMPTGPDYWVRREIAAVIVDALRLMLPVCIGSGFLFTVIGRSVEREVDDAPRATSLLTFANTAGAAIGAVAAGFFLIPSLGVERSLLCIAILYGVVSVLTMNRRSLVSIAALAVALILFPSGRMREKFIPLSASAFLDSSTRIRAVREGVVETSVYLESDPQVYRLFTNGFSMSATTPMCRRYMTLFADLPLAFRPNARSALLISYGVGVTAKALTNSRQLESIDVVDVSRDILDLGEIVWPGAANPLRDPRVRVHVEDGRFFLAATPRRFDLITAEPPPPKNAGVVSLYTLEYFRLLHDRLTAHGIATYWLPVDQLTKSDTRALVAAFCGAFEDCSLWNGADANLILMGSRGELGTPASQPTTLMADSNMLRAFVGGAPPVTDDRPFRLSPEQARDTAAELYR